MSDWKESTLGEVVNFQRGFDITRATQRPGNVPVVSSGGIGSYHDTAAAHAPGVVIGRKGTLGKVFYLPEDYWPHDTTLWVQNFKGSEPRFVYYFMSQVDVSWLDAGSANPTLNRNHLHPLSVLWPPVLEQRAISEVLGALDDKIASNTKIANTADELAATLTTRAIKAGPEILLTEIAHVTMGSSPIGSSLNENSDGTVFYQGIRDFGLRYPSRRVWTAAPGRMAKELDTLLSVRAPVGSANIASESICIGRGIASIRSKIGTPYTLFHTIRSSPAWNQYNSEGTVFGSINRKQLESVHLRWVAPQDLREHESNLTSLEQVIRETTATIETLVAIREVLLPQLMSGRLRVKDAAQIVSTAV